MVDGNRIRDEVKKLPRSGRHITGITEQGRKAMPRILFSAIRRKFGITGGWPSQSAPS